MGKSSLVNALVPDANVKTAGLVRHASIGAHTTSNARWHYLPQEEDGPGNGTGVGKGAIIDCPGIRELAVWHLDSDWVWTLFHAFDWYASLLRHRLRTDSKRLRISKRAAVFGIVDTVALKKVSALSDRPSKTVTSTRSDCGLMANCSVLIWTEPNEIFSYNNFPIQKITFFK